MHGSSKDLHRSNNASSARDNDNKNIGGLITDISPIRSVSTVPVTSGRKRENICSENEITAVPDGEANAFIALRLQEGKSSDNVNRLMPLLQAAQNNSNYQILDVNAKYEGLRRAQSDIRLNQNDRSGKYFMTNGFSRDTIKTCNTAASLRDPQKELGHSAKKIRKRSFLKRCLLRGKMIFPATTSYIPKVAKITYFRYIRSRGHAAKQKSFEKIKPREHSRQCSGYDTDQNDPDKNLNEQCPWNKCRKRELQPEPMSPSQCSVDDMCHCDEEVNAQQDLAYSTDGESLKYDSSLHSSCNQPDFQADIDNMSHDRDRRSISQTSRKHSKQFTQSDRRSLRGIRNTNGLCPRQQDERTCEYSNSHVHDSGRKGKVQSKKCSKNNSGYQSKGHGKTESKRQSKSRKVGSTYSPNQSFTRSAHDPEFTDIDSSYTNENFSHCQSLNKKQNSVSKTGTISEQTSRLRNISNCECNYVENKEMSYDNQTNVQQPHLIQIPNIKQASTPFIVTKKCNRSYGIGKVTKLRIPSSQSEIERTCNRNNCLFRSKRQRASDSPLRYCSNLQKQQELQNIGLLQQHIVPSYPISVPTLAVVKKPSWLCVPKCSHISPNQPQSCTVNNCPLTQLENTSPQNVQGSQNPTYEFPNSQFVTAPICTTQTCDRYNQNQGQTNTLVYPQNTFETVPNYNQQYNPNFSYSYQQQHQHSHGQIQNDQNYNLAGYQGTQHEIPCMCPSTARANPSRYTCSVCNEQSPTRTTQNTNYSCPVCNEQNPTRVRQNTKFFCPVCNEYNVKKERKKCCSCSISERFGKIFRRPKRRDSATVCTRQEMPQYNQCEINQKEATYTADENLNRIPDISCPAGICSDRDESTNLINNVTAADNLVKYPEFSHPNDLSYPKEICSNELKPYKNSFSADENMMKVPESSVSEETKNDQSYIKSNEANETLIQEKTYVDVATSFNCRCPGKTGRQLTDDIPDAQTKENTESVFSGEELIEKDEKRKEEIREKEKDNDEKEATDNFYEKIYEESNLMMKKEKVGCKYKQTEKKFNVCHVEEDVSVDKCGSPRKEGSIEKDLNIGDPNECCCVNDEVKTSNSESSNTSSACQCLNKKSRFQQRNNDSQQEETDSETSTKQPEGNIKHDECFCSSVSCSEISSKQSYGHEASDKETHLQDKLKGSDYCNSEKNSKRFSRKSSCNENNPTGENYERSSIRYSNNRDESSKKSFSKSSHKNNDIKLTGSLKEPCECSDIFSEITKESSNTDTTPNAIISESSEDEFKRTVEQTENEKCAPCCLFKSSSNDKPKYQTCFNNSRDSKKHDNIFSNIKSDESSYTKMDEAYKRQSSAKCPEYLTHTTQKLKGTDFCVNNEFENTNEDEAKTDNEVSEEDIIEKHVNERNVRCLCTVSIKDLCGPDSHDDKRPNSNKLKGEDYCDEPANEIDGPKTNRSISKSERQSKDYRASHPGESPVSEKEDSCCCLDVKKKSLNEPIQESSVTECYDNVKNCKCLDDIKKKSSLKSKRASREGKESCNSRISGRKSKVNGDFECLNDKKRTLTKTTQEGRSARNSQVETTCKCLDTIRKKSSQKYKPTGKNGKDNYDSEITNLKNIQADSCECIQDAKRSSNQFTYQKHENDSARKENEDTRTYLDANMKKSSYKSESKNNEKRESCNSATSGRRNEIKENCKCLNDTRRSSSKSSHPKNENDSAADENDEDRTEYLDVNKRKSSHKSQHLGNEGKDSLNVGISDKKKELQDCCKCLNAERRFSNQSAHHINRNDSARNEEDASSYKYSDVDKRKSSYKSERISNVKRESLNIETCDEKKELEGSCKCLNNKRSSTNQKNDNDYGRNIENEGACKCLDVHKRKSSHKSRRMSNENRESLNHKISDKKMELEGSCKCLIHKRSSGKSTHQKNELDSGRNEADECTCKYLNVNKRKSSHKSRSMSNEKRESLNHKISDNKMELEGSCKCLIHKRSSGKSTHQKNDLDSGRNEEDECTCKYLDVNKRKSSHISERMTNIKRKKCNYDEYERNNAKEGSCKCLNDKRSSLNKNTVEKDENNYVPNKEDEDTYKYLNDDKRKSSHKSGRMSNVKRECLNYEVSPEKNEPEDSSKCLNNERKSSTKCTHQMNENFDEDEHICNISDINKRKSSHKSEHMSEEVRERLDIGISGKKHDLDCNCKCLNNCRRSSRRSLQQKNGNNSFKNAEDEKLLKCPKDINYKPTYKRTIREESKNYDGDAYNRQILPEDNYSCLNDKRRRSSSKTTKDDYKTTCKCLSTAKSKPQHEFQHEIEEVEDDGSFEYNNDKRPSLKQSTEQKDKNDSAEEDDDESSCKCLHVMKRKSSHKSERVSRERRESCDGGICDKKSSGKDGYEYLDQERKRSSRKSKKESDFIKNDEDEETCKCLDAIKERSSYKSECTRKSERENRTSGIYEKMGEQKNIFEYFDNKRRSSRKSTHQKNENITNEEDYTVSDGMNKPETSCECLRNKRKSSNKFKPESNATENYENVETCQYLDDRKRKLSHKFERVGRERRSSCDGIISDRKNNMEDVKKRRSTSKSKNESNSNRKDYHENTCKCLDVIKEKPLYKSERNRKEEREDRCKEIIDKNHKRESRCEALDNKERSSSKFTNKRHSAKKDINAEICNYLDTIKRRLSNSHSCECLNERKTKSSRKSTNKNNTFELDERKSSFKSERSIREGRASHDNGTSDRRNTQEESIEYLDDKITSIQSTQQKTASHSSGNNKYEDICKCLDVVKRKSSHKDDRLSKGLEGFDRQISNKRNNGEINHKCLHGKRISSIKTSNDDDENVCDCVNILKRKLSLKSEKLSQEKRKSCVSKVSDTNNDREDYSESLSGKRKRASSKSTRQTIDCNNAKNNENENSCKCLEVMKYKRSRQYERLKPHKNENCDGKFAKEDEGVDNCECLHDKRRSSTVKKDLEVDICKCLDDIIENTQRARSESCGGEKSVRNKRESCYEYLSLEKKKSLTKKNEEEINCNCLDVIKNKTSHKLDHRNREKRESCGRRINIENSCQCLNVKKRNSSIKSERRKRENRDENSKRCECMYIKTQQPPSKREHANRERRGSRGVRSNSRKEKSQNCCECKVSHHRSPSRKIKEKSSKDDYKEIAAPKLKRRSKSKDDRRDDSNKSNRNSINTNENTTAYGGNEKISSCACPNSPKTKPKTRNNQGIESSDSCVCPGGIKGNAEFDQNKEDPEDIDDDIWKLSCESHSATSLEDQCSYDVGHNWQRAKRMGKENPRETVYRDCEGFSSSVERDKKGSRVKSGSCNNQYWNKTPVHTWKEYQNKFRMSQSGRKIASTTNQESQIICSEENIPNQLNTEEAYFTDKCGSQELLRARNCISDSNELKQKNRSQVACYYCGAQLENMNDTNSCSSGWENSITNIPSNNFSESDKGKGQNYQSEISCIMCKYKNKTCNNSISNEPTFLKRSSSDFSKTSESCLQKSTIGRICYPYQNKKSTHPVKKKFSIFKIPGTKRKSKIKSYNTNIKVVKQETIQLEEFDIDKVERAYPPPKNSKNIFLEDYISGNKLKKSNKSLVINRKQLVIAKIYTDAKKSRASKHRGNKFATTKLQKNCISSHFTVSASPVELRNQNTRNVSHKINSISVEGNCAKQCNPNASYIGNSEPNDADNEIYENMSIRGSNTRVKIIYRNYDWNNISVPTIAENSRHTICDITDEKSKQNRKL